MKNRIALLTIFLLFFGSGLQAAEKEAISIKFVTAAYEGDQGKSLLQPEGVACSEDGFWVADTGNSRLVHFTQQNRSLSPDTEIKMKNTSPTVVQVNSKGEIHVLDAREQRIALLKNNGKSKGYLTPENIPEDRDITPKSFRIDGEDNIYILDLLSSRVLVLGPEGEYRREIAFPEEYGFFSDLALDSRGTIFLLDSVKGEIYTAAVDGDRFSLLTSKLKEYVNFPTSLAVDSRGGKIYVLDQYGSGLVLIDQDGSFLGRRLSRGWKKSQLYYPAQLCLTTDNQLLIADRNNNRVQLFTTIKD
ncbi:MAG: hypothetical protein ACLFV2_06645 [Desulfurivibrionaceae bacterium]